MRKEKRIDALGITVRELTMRHICAFLDAEEDDILGMIFGGDKKEKPVTPDTSDGEFLRRVDLLCRACVDLPLKDIVKKALDWTPSDLIELWAAFSEVNRPLMRLPQVIALSEAARGIGKALGDSMARDLKKALPGLSDPGTGTR